MSNFNEKGLSLLTNKNQIYIENNKHKIKTRKHSILAIFFTTLLFLGGCGMLNMFTESYEDIRDEMLQHLYEKYGVEFIGDSLERGSHDFLIAYPKYGDMQEDHVRMQRHGSGENVRFSDTFFGVIIRDEIESIITTALADIGLPFKVFFSSHIYYFDNKFDSTKTFADFNAWVAEGNRMRITIGVWLEFNADENVDEYANRAFEYIEELGYLLHVNLQFAPTIVFEQVTRSNRITILQQSRGERTTFNRSVN